MAETGSRNGPKPAVVNEQYLYELLHCESEKNWATFIFTVTLSNVGHFNNFFVS